MIFNSFDFIIFFIVVTISYYILPHRARWVLLLIASYIFYMAWRAELIVLIVFSTFINYTLSHKIYRCKKEKKKKDFLILSLVLNFGLLFVFKYLMFASDVFQSIFIYFGLNYPVKEFDIILPMGISFYTFQAASYTIDVYKGLVKPVKSYGKFSLFITFFPQLVAGPIERSKNLLPQFYEKHKFDIAQITMGLKIMSWGFFKKVVIADRAAVFVNTVFNNLNYYSGITLVLAAVLFKFQIYCDFSGYSDIAKGCSKVLGFRLMDNFDRPFLAKSIKEFWKRWHISLSNWFMDYVYIPLGGNRKGKLLQQRNLLITFLVSGLWHGANWTFIIWGGLHGIFIVIDNLTYRIRYKIKKVFGYDRNIISTSIMDFFGIIITFSLVVFAIISFRANTVGDFIYVLKHILWGVRNWLSPMYVYQSITSTGFGLYDLTVVIISILILMVVEIFGGKDLHENLMKANSVFRVSFYGIIVSLILSWGVFYSAGAFIYFQF